MGKNMTTLYMIFAVVCTIGASIFTFLATKTDSKATEDRLSGQITDLQEENKRLNEENNRLSAENLANTNLMLGKDSHPVAYKWDYTPDMMFLNLNIQLFGVNPLKNIDVYATVVENYTKTGFPFDVRPFQLTTQQRGKPNLKIQRMTNGSDETNIITVPISDEFGVFIFYQGDVKKWAQYFYFIKVDNKLEHLNIVTDGNRFVLYKDISENYPMTDDGYVFLNEYAKFKYDDLVGTRIYFPDAEKSNESE